MGLFDDIVENLDKERTGGKGFARGTHEVLIMLAEAQTDAKGRDVIKITVCDKEDEEKTGEATLWFHSKGGAKMAMDKVLRLLVHNVDEDKKPKVKELGKKLTAGIDDLSKGRDVALKLLTEKLIGKEAYFVVEPSGIYSTSKYGDIWYYPAQPKGDRNPKVDMSQAGDVTEDELPDFGDDL